MKAPAAIVAMKFLSAVVDLAGKEAGVCGAITATFAAVLIAGALVATTAVLSAVAAPDRPIANVEVVTGKKPVVTSTQALTITHFLEALRLLIEFLQSPRHLLRNRNVSLNFA